MVFVDAAAESVCGDSCATHGWIDEIWLKGFVDGLAVYLKIDSTRWVFGYEWLTGDVTTQNVLVTEELLSFFDIRKKKAMKCFEDQKVISTENSSIVPSRSCIGLCARGTARGIVIPCVVEGTTEREQFFVFAGLAEWYTRWRVRSMRKHVFGNVSIQGPAPGSTDILCSG